MSGGTIVSFAGRSVAIQHHDPLSSDIVEFLYRDVPCEPGILPRVTLRLDASDPGGMFVLRRDELVLYEGRCQGTLATALLGETAYQLVDDSREGLLFHAAALAWHGGGLLLPGQSGAGKTTLATWLTGEGFDYLTDELVFVAKGATSLHAFTRPLNLKREALPFLKDRWRADANAHPVIATPEGVLASALHFNPMTSPTVPELHLIIFPRYQPHAPFFLRPLSKAERGMQLLACLVNARNLPEHGFAEVTRLARHVPAYAMTYGNFAQLGGRIETLLGNHAHGG
jgi:hypothetical protein